ncbi:hypothetical protein [Natronobacterium gregoryi]|uniref:Uncharacterized protein n=2 Tax=Natronobacterium gregoryi TaxID=44930 RepID=L0AIL6_NATGS|nr:hypothetical protein [Natronobacterium gregoryi]AFZ73022.1 hypothetical protein Natgr_1832 [Natronobacterium gregoryi SP2]ELY64877.1 hypothetical protein C490_14365 [Natronobacterium gregoryi SP2]PLK18382.1 hypothetical protein CYV19_18090 [Natronobacterium gregoryi SP2]SFJ71709.1 hypothetical protein SAMN05443661_16416 [Natronobacterium gregoryi]
MHDTHSFERTVATLVLFGVWATIVLGPMFLEVDPPASRIRLTTTAVVFLVLGRMWGIDFEQVLDCVTISIGDRLRDDE